MPKKKIMKVILIILSALLAASHSIDECCEQNEKHSE